MSTFFLICAIAGGTILVLQLGMALIGLGGDLAGDGVEVPDADLDVDVDVDVDTGDGMTVHDAGGLSGLAKKLTFQGIVAFVTFFGVGGLSAQGFGWSNAASAAAAGGAGLGAMVLLGYAFGGLRKLQGSGSLHLSNAVGGVGRVYLRVPAGNGGVGKIIVAIQGRSEEIRATTPGPELRPGDAVVVTRAVDDRTLEVVSQAAYVDKAGSIAD